MPDRPIEKALGETFRSTQRYDAAFIVKFIFAAPDRIDRSGDAFDRERLDVRALEQIRASRRRQQKVF